MEGSRAPESWSAICPWLMLQPWTCCGQMPNYVSHHAHAVQCKLKAASRFQSSRQEAQYISKERRQES